MSTVLHDQCPVGEWLIVKYHFSTYVKHILSCCAIQTDSSITVLYRFYNLCSQLRQEKELMEGFGC